MAALAAIGDDVVGDLLCVGRDGRVTYANAAARHSLAPQELPRATQLTAPPELAGRALAELLPAVLGAPLVDAVAAALGGGAASSFELPRDDAHPFGGRHCRVTPLPQGAAILLRPRAVAAPPIARMVRQLNQSLELERIVALVARHAADLLGAHHAALLALEGDELVVVSLHGPCSLAVGQRLPVSRTFSGEAIRAGRPVRVRGAAAHHERWPALAGDAEALAGADAILSGEDRTGGIRDTVIAAPLVMGGRATGAICVSGHATRDFDERDELLLAELADHAAVAVENARLYSAAARSARHEGILAETAAVLTASVTPTGVYEGVSRVATTELDAAGACIFLADPESGQVELAHCDASAERFRDQALRRFWQLDTGLAARSGNPCFVPDLSDLSDLSAGAGSDPGGRGDSRLPFDDARAYAVLPLAAAGRVRGVLALRYSRPQRFDADERRLLGDFATQVAVAMRNAALVNDLERRAARLVAVARVQQAMARADIGEVYAEVHRAVATVVDAPAFAVLAADDTATTFSPRYVVVDGHELPAHSIAASAARDAVAAEACRRDQPLRERPPVWSWSAALDPEPGREWRRASAGVVAPIRHGERVLGVLHVQSYHADAYAPEDADLVAIIARQAGAALELARLFGAEQRERELAQASAEIARLALGASTVHAVADELLQVVDRVAPSAGKALGVIRPDGTLEYVGTTGAGDGYRGFSVAADRSLTRFLRPPGSSEIADLSAVVGRDPRIVPPEMAALLVPLVARERVIGLIVVATAIGTTPGAESREALSRLAAPMALALDVLTFNEAEQRRIERERMLAAALATMDQPVFVLAPDGQVRYANEAALREYGYSREQLAGLPVERLTGPLPPPGAADAAATGAARPNLLSSSPPVVEATPVLHHRSDGSAFPVSVTRAPIRDEEGELVGEVLVVRNLTEERRVAEQLRQHEKLAALGSLVAGVAHELNNPLTGISAFAQLLLEEPLDAEQSESVRLIKREADRAVSVIRDLLLFSRKTDAQLDQVDVNAMVQLTIRLRTYTLRSEGIEVEFDLSADSPRVIADEQRLQQVLLNLLVNAEYALHGASERRLTIRTRRERDEVVIEVADTGPGMDAETQRHIFEPFFTTKPPGVGTGLGLSVSYGIVQAHGGGITVESRPGGGTTFRIALPAPPRPTHVTARP